MSPIRACRRASTTIGRMRCVNRGVVIPPVPRASGCFVVRKLLINQPPSSREISGVHFGRESPAEMKRPRSARDEWHVTRSPVTREASERRQMHKDDTKDLSLMMMRAGRRKASRFRLLFVCVLLSATVLAFAAGADPGRAMAFPFAGNADSMLPATGLSAPVEPQRVGKRRASGGRIQTEKAVPFRFGLLLPASGNDHAELLRVDGPGRACGE